MATNTIGRNERVYFKVHYLDREEAKKMGCKWDAEAKLWWSPLGNRRLEDLASRFPLSEETSDTAFEALKKTMYEGFPTRIRINTKPGTGYSTVTVLDYDHRLRKFVEDNGWFWNGGYPSGFQVTGEWYMTPPDNLRRSIEEQEAVVDKARKRLASLKEAYKEETEGESESNVLYREMLQDQEDWVTKNASALEEGKRRLREMERRGFEWGLFDTDEKFDTLRMVVGWFLENGMEVKARQERSDEWTDISTPSDIDALQKKKE